MTYDAFIWLENLSDPKTIKFIEEHNKRFRDFVGNLPNMFINRIKRYYDLPFIGIIKATSKGVYAIVRESDVYSIKLFNWDKEVTDIITSKDLGKHVVIGAIYPSLNGDVLGLFYTIAGSDEGFLRIIDPESKEVLDELRGSVRNVVWIDKYSYYYVRFYRSDKTPDGVKAPAARVFLREITSGSEEMVFGKGIDTNYMIWINEPWDLSRVFITVQYGWDRSLIYGGYRNDPYSWKLLFDGKEYLVRTIGYYNGIPYLAYYDREGLGRIIRIVNGNVEEIVGEQDYPLNKAIMVKDKIYVNYLANAASRLKVYDVDGKLVKEYAFSEPSSIRALDFYDNRVFILLECFSKPPAIYELREKELREFYGYKVDLNLRVSEEWTTSFDGTRIHMFIIEHKSRKRDVALVYGYGGFGVSITPFFVGALAPFIEDGGVLVVANLRGGGEYGEKWHRMGMRENKQNVFEDYKAVLRHVRKKGLRTIGWGVSNGGLLIAATMVQEPQLFDAAIIGYPVIDMLRFHKLYIGRLWTTEYGNPDDPKDREYLLKYSPYHNVRKQKYPITLIYTGLHDDRVHPGHALKFTAKLEEVRAPVYLRVETASGHMGSSPEVKVKEYSDMLAFIYKALRLKPLEYG